jgi:hypothetical protein
MYLKKQLEDNVECKSKLKKIEMICKKKIILINSQRRKININLNLLRKNVNFKPS